MKCRGESILFPNERVGDSVRMSDASPRCSALAKDNDEPVAVFAVGHSARQDGDLTVRNAGGKIATFHGSVHTAEVASDGRLFIHRTPGVEQAATTDASLALSQRLAGLNRKNAEFYRRKS